MYKRILIFISLLLCSFVLFAPLISSASVKVDPDAGSSSSKVDPDADLKAVPSEGEHWYRVVAIYHPQQYTQYTVSGVLRSSDQPFTALAAYPAIEYYNLSYQGTNYRAFEGDILVFTGEQLTAAPDAFKKLLLDERYFVEITFEPDQTSIFRNIRSTIAHYVFSDNFDNVPFGTGVVDFAAGFLCILLFCLPFVVVYFILGRVLR